MSVAEKSVTETDNCSWREYNFFSPYGMNTERQRTVYQDASIYFQDIVVLINRKKRQGSDEQAALIGLI
jgi:hypothetical protein